ncbi:MAG: hypothetical protein ABIP01_06405 [Candidatus Limnocylindria bacterium]
MTGTAIQEAESVASLPLPSAREKLRSPMLDPLRSLAAGVVRHGGPVSSKGEAYPMGLMGWIGKVIATLIGGPAVAVIGDPAEPAAGRVSWVVPVAIAVLVVVFALSMYWGRP